MMMAYHDGQPFNDNMYRPCPMLENPQKLREMVEKSEHIPQIFSHRRVQSISVRNVTGMLKTGSR